MLNTLPRIMLRWHRWLRCHNHSTIIYRGSVLQSNRLMSVLPPMKTTNLLLHWLA